MRCESRSADRAIMRSTGCRDASRLTATPSEEIEIVLGNRPRRWSADGWIDPKLSAIYVIAANALGLVKVGHTRDIRTRLTILNAESPVALELAHFVYVAGPPLSKIVEAEAHAGLADHRVRGEWFSVSAEAAGQAIGAALAARGFKFWSELDRQRIGFDAAKIHDRIAA